mmetsp:Transcript_7350/g.27481  ORF Transcript_7350/g.27481 Transcript_7350/m.27481 type:complete len:96 (-) Transcript_7350:270-557(-)
MRLQVMVLEEKCAAENFTRRRRKISHRKERVVMSDEQIFNIIKMQRRKRVGVRKEGCGVNGLPGVVKSEHFYLHRDISIDAPLASCIILKKLMRW